MILSLRNFAQTVQDAAAVAQAAAASALDFTVGSVLRSLIEATASISLWMQFVALQVLSATRLATSTGTDVDSFVADYGLTRLPAVAATGVVTFARYSSAAQAVIVPGVQVKTTDGTQIFGVVADTSQATWSVTANAYVLPIGTASASVTVQAVNLGSQGNVLSGSISLLATAVPYVDTVTNAAAFANGKDAESDAALRVRFQLYLTSLARGTVDAVAAAIVSVQQGLTYVIQENTPGTGHFTVTIDDGSGAPPLALRNAVYAAIDLVRPIGSTFSVQSPSVVSASVAVTLTLPATVARPPVVAAVNAALVSYIASLGVGQPLAYNYLSALVFGASPLITNATITLNGGTADLASGATGVIRASSITVA